MNNARRNLLARIPRLTADDLDQGIVDALILAEQDDNPNAVDLFLHDIAVALDGARV